MRTKYILGIVSAAMMLSGCMKGDIEELRKGQTDIAARVAALEAWQATVNSNITSLKQLVTALENNDYVTSVVSFTTPEPGGYRVTFSKSGEATIWNGDKGDTGDTGAAGHAPAVGVAQYPESSGIYYWTLDGQFITHDGTPAGDKMPVRGDDGDPGAAGATPKVAIGSDGYWYISPDGTTTGTDPSDPASSGWTNTGVQAEGPKGDRGDAIFADNGISQDDDSVTFTLANGGGTITLQKYKAFGITFDQPGLFAAGASQTISYTGTGTVAPTRIRIVDLPFGWTYTVDYTLGSEKLVVTAPSVIRSENFAGEATVLAGVDDQVVGMYALKLVADFTGPAGNHVGAVYYLNGESAGIVFQVSTGSGDGRVVKLTESGTLYWSIGTQATGATSHTDGLANMAAVYASYGDNFDLCPAFSAVHAMNPAGTVYSSGMTNTWYLPAGGEFVTLSGIWVSDPDQFNNWLIAAGGTGIIRNRYWTSTEATSYSSYSVEPHLVRSGAVGKDTSAYRVRAFLAF